MTTFIDELKDSLRTKRLKLLEGKGGGGCINKGEAYEIDDGKIVFVKTCSKENAAEIICGEFESLKAIKSTNTVRVPQPMTVVADPDSANMSLVMEYIEKSSLSEQQAKLGEKLAELHLHNSKKDEVRKYNNSYLGRSLNNDDDSVYVEEFGFDSVTCCGAIPMNNEWCSDWVSFYARNRLQSQINMIWENYGDRTVTELWSELQLKIPKYFQVFTEEDIEIAPSMLHGDLWSGNACEVEEEPIIFDPCCFYGHSEYDLAISDMFGGFRPKFYEHYRTLIKKVPGFEKRIELYQLFHYLNHWNHFGGGYKQQSLNLMKKLNRI